MRSRFQHAHLVGRDDFDLIHHVADGASRYRQHDLIAEEHVLQTAEEPISMSGQPRFPSPPGSAGARVLPGPPLRVRAAGPSNTRTPRPSLRIVITAMGPPD